jgi:hypothetical protein
MHAPLLLTPLPRLAPSVVRRPRLISILEATRSLPLRLVAAPVGAGKTTLLAHYLAGASGSAAYLALAHDETPESFRARLATALHLPYEPASFAALLAALATLAPLELGVDECDRATSETREELAALVEELPEGISVLYGARARATIDRGRLLARGLATLIDAQTLAFDADEVASLATSLGVTHARTDAVRLCEETDGWPLAAAWVVRCAAERGAPLEGAFERWCATERRHLAAFVEQTVAETPGADRANVVAAARGREPADSPRLAALEARGLFVRYVNDGLRPYRVLERVGIPTAATAPPSESAAALLAVRMFGRFEAKIGGTPIAWIRRREAQIFKYLLLKPGGSATRAELCEVFWPGTSAHAATQSLRTACSNMRKAIAQLVGHAAVDRYFTTDGDVAVPLDHAAIDVRRFIAHVADGDADLERGRTQEAFAHFRAAEELYVGELLCGDFPEPWYAPRAEMFKSLFRGVLERLADLHRDAGRARQADEYAQRSRAIAAGTSANPMPPAEHFLPLTV